MEIKNTAKKYLDDPAVVTARNCIIARGEYLYQLVNEAKKKGLSSEFAHCAIYNWGDSIRRRLKDPETTNVKEIIDQLFTEMECKIWEDEVTATEEEARVEFHYCPLLEGWLRNTDDPQMLQELCDIAMECDVALFDKPRFDYSIEESFFSGADHCTMVIRKHKPETEGDTDAH